MAPGAGDQPYPAPVSCAMGWDGGGAAAWGHGSVVLGGSRARCLAAGTCPGAVDVHEPRVPVAVSRSYVYGQTLVAEVAGGPRPTVHMLWTPVPRALTLPEGQRERCWQFLTAVADSREEAERSYGEGLALAAVGALHASHAQAWAARWGGCGVELDGPLALRKAVRGALYYLLSAIPPQGSPGFPFHGISPGGLSNGARGEDYWGHVFWDQVRGGSGGFVRLERTQVGATGLCSANHRSGDGVPGASVQGEGLGETPRRGRLGLGWVRALKGFSSQPGARPPTCSHLGQGWHLPPSSRLRCRRQPCCA